MQYYMLHKPAGCITASRDERRPTVFDHLPEDFSERFFAVGRLDKDTVGLLLITDDGALTARLLHPDGGIEKTYECLCVGEICDEKLARLTDGVYLDRAKEILSRPATARLLSTGQLSEVASYLTGKDISLARRRPKTPVFRLSVTVTEGKKHQIKRMLLAVGCRVVWLCRRSMGPLLLDPSLPVGAHRPLTAEEIAALYRAAGLDALA